MNKEILAAIFQEIGDANFEITTNLGDVFVAEETWSEKEKYGDRMIEYYNKINFVEINDGYVCIEVNKQVNGDEWENGIRRYFIPMSRIAKVTKLCHIRPKHGTFIRKVSTRIMVR